MPEVRIIAFPRNETLVLEERYTSHRDRLIAFACLNEIIETIDSDAILSSTLTPASEGGRLSSHSDRFDMIEASPFVSAWDLYIEEQSRALTLIGSSDEPGLLPEPCVCACVCVRVCAYPEEEGQQTVPSTTVPKEDSQ